MKPPVAVVIPNWNGADYIAACLSSLEKQSYTAQIIVVDNGSKDESLDIIKKQFPKVTLIELDHNHGFAGGVNVGIKHALEAGCKYVALFNNDAEADKDWLKALVGTLEETPKTGIVTGKFMRMDKKLLDSTGDFYSTWGMPFPRGRNQPDNGQFDAREPVFAASGGASLYRAALLQEIGLFDEDFFAYFEDVDISFRAQLAGWDVLYEPTAVAYHHVSGTSSKLGSFSRYHSSKNFSMLYLKNMPGWLAVKYLPLLGLQTVRIALTSLIKGQLGAFIKGYGRALLLLPATLQKRRTIQKSRKRSTGDIDQLLYHHLPPIIAKPGKS